MASAVCSAPDWLDPSGNLGGTIAVKDHGETPFIFEEQRKTPFGVNMAVRRELVERVGGFRADLGRRGKVAARPGAGGVLLPFMRRRRARRVYP